MAKVAKKRSHLVVDKPVHTQEQPSFEVAQNGAAEEGSDYRAFSRLDSFLQMTVTVSKWDQAAGRLIACSGAKLVTIDGCGTVYAAVFRYICFYFSEPTWL